MDKKQNMNQKMDQLDKQLFEHYKNKNIPSSTQNVIKTAFNNKNKSSMEKYIYKFAIYFISILVLTTGVVFAKDIVNFISSLFTNSTAGIDEAINNGYVQNVNMDFVYDNDIGIKVDYLVVDERKLDISYVYENLKAENISSIAINEYNIRDDNNNLLYYENNSKIVDFDTVISDYTRTEEQILDSNKMYRESILYTIDNFPKLEKLIFEITSITLNRKDVINGNWLFEVYLQQDMLDNKNDTYIVSYNEYVKEITTDLSETSFKIEITLNTAYDDEFLKEPNNIILTNKMDEEYKIKYINFKNMNDDNSNYGQISLEFDVSKYFDNIDDLYLNFRITKDKIINIIMKKT